MLIDEIYLNYQNKNQTLRQWAEALGIPAKRILKRYNKKWSVEKILSKEKIVRTPEISLTYQGKTLKLEEWSKVTGIPKSILYSRYKSKVPLKKMFIKERLTPKEGWKVKIGKEIKTVKEWAKISGISPSTIKDRIRKGLKDKDILNNKRIGFKKTQPAKILIFYKGKKRTLKEISRLISVKEHTLLMRYKKGYRGKELFAKQLPNAFKKEYSKSEIVFIKKIEKEYQDGSSLAELGKKYQMSDRTIKRKLKAIGCKLRTHKKSMNIANEGRNQRLQEKYFKNILNPKLKEWGYKLLEPYVGQDIFKKGKYVSHRPYLLQHIDCGHKFKDDVVNPPRCTKCFKIKGGSYPEDRIEQYLKSLGVKYERNVRMLQNPKGKRKLEVDFFLPEYKVAFEYNGMMWHHQKDKEYHKIKTDVAAQMGIKLYHLWGSQGLENLIEFVGTCLGKGKRILKTSSEEISKELAEEFLSKNSRELFSIGSINVALVNKQGLVAVASFRKRSKNLVMTGFAVKSGVMVKNPLSKLLDFVKGRIRGVKKITGKVSRDWCLELELGPMAKIKQVSGLFYTDRFKSFSLQEKNRLLRTELEWKGQVFYPVWTSGSWHFCY